MVSISACAVALFKPAFELSNKPHEADISVSVNLRAYIKKIRSKPWHIIYDF
jgi:hypothetical protein